MSAFTVTVRCPECGQEIGVPVSVAMPEVEGQGQVMTFEPDTADLWAHSWTHREETS